jgi:hypothetical protein
VSVWLLTLALHHCHLQKTIDTCGKKNQASLAEVLYHAVPYVRIRGNACGDKSQSHSHMVSGSSVSVSVSVYQSSVLLLLCRPRAAGPRAQGPRTNDKQGNRKKTKKQKNKKTKKQKKDVSSFVKSSSDLLPSAFSPQFHSVPGSIYSTLVCHNCCDFYGVCVCARACVSAADVTSYGLRSEI